MSRFSLVSAVVGSLFAAALPLPAQVALRPAGEFATLPYLHGYVIGLQMIQVYYDRDPRLFLFTTQEAYSSFRPSSPQGWQKEWGITSFNLNMFEDSLAQVKPDDPNTYFFTGGLSLNRSIRFQQTPIAVLSNTRIGSFGQLPSGFVLRNPASSGAPVNVFYSIDGQDGSTPGLYRHDDVTTTWTALPGNTFGTSGPGQVTSGVGALQFGPDGLLNVIDTGAQRIFRYNPDTLAYVSEVTLGNSNTNRGAFIITPNGYIMTSFTDSAGGAIYDYATGAMLGTYGTYSAADLHPQNGFGGKTSMTLDPTTGWVYVLNVNPDGSDGLFVYDPSRLLDPAFTDPTRLVVAHTSLLKISDGYDVNVTIIRNNAEFTIMGDNDYPSGIFFQEGTLILGSPGALGSTSTISFSGGTMKFSAANTTDYSARFSTAPGQLYSFDTNGQNVMVGTALTSAGSSLTKSGAGTLTLSGGDTLTGSLTLHDGTLDLGGGTQFFAAGTMHAGTLQNGTLHFSSPLEAHSGVISATLAGSSSLIKISDGKLTLTGANTYTGGTTVNSGVLALGSAQAVGPTGTISFGGGTLQFSAVNTTDYSARFSTAAGQQYAFDTNGQQVTLATALTSDGGSLAKYGSGTLTLSGANTYTGGTTVNGGVLALASLQALGPGGTISLGGGTLQFSAADTTDYSARFSTAAGQQYAFDTNGQQVTLATALTSNGGSLTKTGSGTLSLTGANTYTGQTTVTGGTLDVSAGNHRLPAGGNILLTNGATLDLGGTTQTANLGIYTNATGVGYAGYLQQIGTVGNVTAGVLQSSVDQLLQAGTYDATFTDNEPLGRTYIGGDAGATVTLNGANDRVHASSHIQVIIGQGGAVSLGILGLGAAGTVKLGSANALAAATEATHIYSGTLDLNGQTGVRGREIAFKSAANGALVNSSVANAASFNQSVTFDADVTAQVGGAGTLALGGVLSGSGALNKIGAGTLTLSGTNTYAGPTTVSAGTLRINGNNGSSAVTVNSGARLGGSGTVGALTLNAGATLAPGNSPGTLSAANTTWNGGANYVWEINNATGTAGTNYDLLSISGSLTINSTAGNKFTLSLVSLLANNTAGDAINFNAAQNYSYTIASATGGIIGFDANAFSINASGFTNNLNGGAWNLAQVGNDLKLNFAAASAIPEPSTYAAIFGALALGLTIYRQRARRP